MKLWLLKPSEINNEAWEPWYYKACGFVVRAETEKKARQIANDNGGDEVGKIRNEVYRGCGDPWLDPKQSSCIELINVGASGLILRDYMSA